MEEFMTEKFWTFSRRKWLYAVMVSLMPILITFGSITGETAGMILSAIGTILGVGGGAMALGNLTPDEVYTIAVKEETSSDDE